MSEHEQQVKLLEDRLYSSMIRSNKFNELEFPEQRADRITEALRGALHRYANHSDLPYQELLNKLTK